MRFTVVVAVHLALVAAAFAGSNRWTTSGPGVGLVTNIQVDPSNSLVAYARTPVGIYRTTNAGQSWSALAPGRLGEFVEAGDSTLFAAAGDKVVGSTDGGDHWSAPGTTAGGSILALAYDAKSGTLYAGTNNGLSVSADGGQSWTTSPLLVAATQVVSFAVTSNAVYAVALTANAQFVDLRSTDEGRTWQLLPEVGQFYLFGYAGSASLYSYTLNTVLISNDLGQSWKRSAISKAAGVESLAVSDAGVYASTNAGLFAYDSRRDSWSSIGDRVLLRTLGVSSSAPARLYGFSANGVMTLDSGAQRWAAAGAGLPGANAVDVAMGDADPSVRYTLGANGFYRTDDSGESWRRLSGIQPTNTSEIAISPDSENTLFAWGNGSVEKTSDGGATWTTVTPKFATKLAIAPSRPGTIYAAFADGMATSTDGGISWAPGAGIPFDSYDYGYYGDRVFYADAIAVDPSNDANAFVGKHGGLYGTTDGGTNWSLTSAAPDLHALQIDAAHSETMYAIDASGRVVRSDDRGASWRAAGLIDKPVASLALSGQRLYAAAADGHVYFIERDDSSWTGMDPLSNGASRIAVDASGTHLAAATAAGVWQYDILGQDTVAARLSEDPLRLPQALEALVAAPASDAGLVIPVIGTVRGAGGMSFTTELSLVNRAESAQRALLVWLPADGTAAQAFSVDLPQGSIVIWDAGERFGIGGIGSLAVFAIDGDGNVNTNASIDAAAEIWSHPADGRAPVSQAVVAARPAQFARHSQAESRGFEHDAQFRTNVGIVNLADTAHDFTVRIDGARASGQTLIHVPAFAIVQMPLPQSDYGELSLTVTADEPAAWLFYGSSINRLTGEGRTSIGTTTEP